MPDTLPEDFELIPPPQSVPEGFELIPPPQFVPEGFKLLPLQQPEPMPTIVEAGKQGLLDAIQELGQSAQALRGQKPQPVEHPSPAAAALQWSDIWNPISQGAPKLAYLFAKSAPTLAGGIAGTGTGATLTRHPAGAIAGGAIGAALTSAAQALGPYFLEEVNRTPNDPDGAYDRAVERAEVSGAFSGAAWALFPLKAFSGPLKNILFQAFAVQPGVAIGERAAQNVMTGQPVTQDIGQAYAQGAAGTLVPMAGHALFKAGTEPRLSTQAEIDAFIKAATENAPPSPAETFWRNFHQANQPSLPRPGKGAEPSEGMTPENEPQAPRSVSPQFDEKMKWAETQLKTEPMVPEDFDLIDESGRPIETPSRADQDIAAESPRPKREEAAGPRPKGEEAEVAPKAKTAPLSEPAVEEPISQKQPSSEPAVERPSQKPLSLTSLLNRQGEEGFRRRLAEIGDADEIRQIVERQQIPIFSQPETLEEWIEAALQGAKFKAADRLAAATGMEAAQYNPVKYGPKIESDIRPKEEIPSQETGITDDLRDQFRDLLAGKSKRNEWAGQLGTTPEQMDALIQDMIEEGRLRLDKKGNPIRTPLARQARPREAMPATQNVRGAAFRNADWMEYDDLLKEAKTVADGRFSRAFNPLHKHIDAAGFKRMRQIGNLLFQNLSTIAKLRNIEGRNPASLDDIEQAIKRALEARDAYNAALANQDVQALKVAASDAMRAVHQAFSERLLLREAARKPLAKEAEDDEPLYALRGFYSPAIRAAEKVKQEKATADQWLAQIKKTPGVKQEELDWMELEDWLKKQKGSISKADVLAFMRGHQVELEERVLGANEPRRQDLSAEENTSTKFEGHKIHGGEPGSYREFLIRFPALEGKYKSPHFQNQEIVFAQVDDRRLPDGGKGLLPTSIQSDIHQKGRKTGYWSQKDADRYEFLKNKKGLGLSNEQMTDAEWAEYRELAGRYNSGNPTPEAPFKGDLWWQLMLKKLLQYAVENDYDALILPRSDQAEKAAGAPEGSLKIFYDEKIPHWLAQYTKKWGGKIEHVQLPEFKEFNPDAYWRSVRQAILETADRTRSERVDDDLRGVLRDFTLIRENAEPNVFHTINRIYNRIGDETFGELAPRLDQLNAEFGVNERKHGVATSGGSNPILRITPQMRESVLEGQPQFAQIDTVTRAFVETRLSAGKAVPLKPEVYRNVLDAIKPDVKLAPKDIATGSLSKIEPYRNFDKTDRVRLTFTTLDGEEFTHDVRWSDVADARAATLYAPNGSVAVGLLRFDFAQGSDATFRGEWRHELDHALFHSGIIPIPERAVLYSTDGLRKVISMGLHDYLRAIGYKDVPEGRGPSIKSVYTKKYAGRSNLQEKINEEHFTHAHELYYHGKLSDADIAPIKHIIDAIENGKFAKEPKFPAKSPERALKAGDTEPDLALTAIRNQFKSWAKTANEWWTPLEALPDVDSYRIGKYKTLGKIAKAEEVAREVYNTFKRGTPQDRRAAYDYLTTKGANPNTIQNPELRAAAVRTKQVIDQIGQSLVAKGLLPRQAYEKYKDEYLPRVYLKHLIEGGNMKGIAGGTRPSKLGYLKKRKNLDAETRLILGEITDPGFLAARGIARPMRDMAIIDFLNQVAGRNEWVLKNNLVTFRGKRVSAHYLASEANALRDRAVYESDPAKAQRMRQYADQMDQIARPAIQATGDVPDGYKRVPDQQRYGMLRGMLVRKEIYNDLFDAFTILPDDPSWAEYLLSPRGPLAKLNQLWKASKVTLNPPTQIRNLISNVILVHMSGVPAHRLSPLIVRAIGEIRSNGRYWQIAKDMGLTATGYNEAELGRIQREFLDIERQNSSWFMKPVLMMKSLGSHVLKGAGDVYQFSEALLKIAKLIDGVEREKLSPEKAYLEAQKYLFDYNEAPRWVRFLRNNPIGVPFITFYYKVLPVLVETAAKRPLKLLPYIAFQYAMLMAFMALYDVTKEEVDRLRMAMSEYLREKNNALILPQKDDKGRWQFLDFGYLMPWGMYQDVISDLARGKYTDALQQSGLLGGPFPDLIVAIKTGIDPFTQKPIYDKRDPADKQMWDIMNYLYRLAAPPWLTDIGAVQKIYEAIENIPTKYGEPGLTKTQAALRFLGLNIYPVEPERQRAMNIRRFQSELRDINARMRQQLNDKRLTPEERRQIQKNYQEKYKQKMQDLSEYARKSKISEKLRTEVRP